MWQKLDREGGCATAWACNHAPSLTVGFLPHSFRGSIEDGVNYVEGNHSRADYCAGCHSAPKDVSAREVPDCEQASDDCHQDAGARSPEGNLRDYAWVEE